MRKRKEKQEISKPMVVAEEENEDEERGNESNGFFSCYLLASACPRYKGHTYIGLESFPLLCHSNNFLFLCVHRSDQIPYSSCL